MTLREQTVADLKQMAQWFRERMDGASKESQNRYFSNAEIVDRAAGMIYSDGETIKEYEAYFDKMEDDGK